METVGGIITKNVFWSKIETCKHFPAAGFGTPMEFSPRVNPPGRTNPPTGADFSILPSGLNYDTQSEKCAPYACIHILVGVYCSSLHESSLSRLSPEPDEAILAGIIRRPCLFPCLAFRTDCSSLAKSYLLIAGLHGCGLAKVIHPQQDQGSTHA